MRNIYINLQGNTCCLRWLKTRKIFQLFYSYKVLHGIGVCINKAGVGNSKCRYCSLKLNGLCTSTEQLVAYSGIRTKPKRTQCVKPELYRKGQHEYCAGQRFLGCVVLRNTKRYCVAITCTTRCYAVVSGLNAFGEIVGFRRGSSDFFRLLGYYAAWGGSKPTFRDYLSAPKRRFQTTSRRIITQKTMNWMYFPITVWSAQSRRWVSAAIAPILEAFREVQLSVCFKSRWHGRAQRYGCRAGVPLPPWQIEI